MSIRRRRPVITPCGWRARYVGIYDLSDPLHPRHVRDFGLVDQEPGSSGPIPAAIHHAMLSPDRKRVYVGGGGGSAVLDREKLIGNPSDWPIPPTPANLLAPQLGRTSMMQPQWNAHTNYVLKDVAVPDFQVDKVGKVHDFLVVVSEAGGWKCDGHRDMTFILDITDPTKPWPVANHQVLESSGNFCAKGGRFGPHSTQENFHPLFYKKLLAIASFNAGVRMVDIRDPFRPVEVAYYIPESNQNTNFCGTEDGVPVCLPVIQTNNAEVDARGLIYIVDRAGTGMHILELTGDAKKIIE